jgi:hypothetical protein
MEEAILIRRTAHKNPHLEDYENKIHYLKDD